MEDLQGSRKNSVLLVDPQDRPLHLMAKLPAHEQGLLHRAFSAYVFQRRQGIAGLLLQKRAASKYHFGGLWTNTCCGHPLDDETPAEAGMRRLPEEMNFLCDLRPVGTFTYRAQSENGLIEHELDHVLVGTYQQEPPAPNPEEAESVRWVALDALDRELSSNPATFTPWFALGYGIARQYA